MRRDGIRLGCRPDIVVRHKMHYTIREYLSQRYLYARSYAGSRAVQMTTFRRLAIGVTKIALPPVLLYRIVSRVLAGGRHGGELAQALPLLLLFACAWAAGEVVGYAAGPGDALSRVN